MSHLISNPALTARIRAPFWVQSGLGTHEQRPAGAFDNRYEMKWRNAADDGNVEAGRAVNGMFVVAPNRVTDAYAYGHKIQTLRKIPLRVVTAAADTAFATDGVHSLSVGQGLEIADCTGEWAALNTTHSVKAAATTSTFTIEASSASFTTPFNGTVYAMDNFFTGTAATKSYVAYIRGDRGSAYAATGDSNDALLRIDGNNWAANDANFILRGINASLNNRSGGTMGIMEHALGIQGKSGGTIPTMKGLSVTNENYGTCATEFGGLSVVLRNEAAVATLEYGIKLSNTNNSIAGDVAHGLYFIKSGANTGWTHAFAFAQDDGHPAQSTSTSVTNVGTNGWIKVKVGAATRYIALGDGVT